MSREQIQKKVRKSNMAAQCQYDYGKLVFPREEFLDCTIQEEKEEILFTYDRKDYKNFSKLKNERRDVILVNLIDCARLVEISRNYKVSLNPENIFYDIHNKVFLMERDVYGRGEEFRMENFLAQYKALIGFALQKRYTYEDYFEGGLDLLKKDKFLEQITELDNVEDIVACLYEEYKSVVERNENTKILVDKKKYRQKRILLGLTSGLLAIALVCIGFRTFYVKPYEDAVVEANRDYIQINYSGVIDALKAVKLNRLTVQDKYILAYSYVECESLTGEQKENIINALSLDTNEKVLDYWIYLGRLDTAMAEDLAQQISDNDLLLYAYLKEKNMVEEDTTISGSTKESRLEVLQGQIDKLTEELQTSEESNSKETENSDTLTEKAKEEDTGELEAIVDTNS